MDLRDEIVTKDDKKHAKREAKACLKHKHYWVNKEEDIIFNGKKAVYKVLNNQDKLTMNHFYHVICDPDLDERFYVMRHIPCFVLGVLNNSPVPCYLTWIKPYNHVMLLNLKRVITLPSYVATINGILPKCSWIIKLSHSRASFSTLHSISSKRVSSLVFVGSR